MIAMAFGAIETCYCAKRRMRTLRRVALHTVVYVGNQHLSIIERRFGSCIGGKSTRMTIAAIGPTLMSTMVEARMPEPFGGQVGFDKVSWFGQGRGSCRFVCMTL